MNKYEWTPELDKCLQDSCVRNIFNFNLVSIDVNNEAQKLDQFCATSKFTSEKCAIRWTYIHAKRKLGKQIKYPDYTKASDDEANTKPIVQKATKQQVPTKTSSSPIVQEEDKENSNS